MHSNSVNNSNSNFNFLAYQKILFLSCEVQLVLPPTRQMHSDSVNNCSNFYMRTRLLSYSEDSILFSGSAIGVATVSLNPLR